MLLILTVRGVRKNNAFYWQSGTHLMGSWQSTVTCKETLRRNLSHLDRKEKGTHDRSFLKLTICLFLLFCVFNSGLLGNYGLT